MSSENNHPQAPQPNGRDAYAVWRNGNYRLYAVSWFLLIFGKMVETVAVGVHIYRDTGDALSLGIIGLVQALPVILLAIPGGRSPIGVIAAA